ncbi:dynamin family protein [Colletotrichum sojae]|uniref:Dynamin family protein n=1 Tax=Colletotrichum sojae TaxID=2175907 RepID=A0A8H6IR41_9PEZI|nr:dynamin family protein [Colletotrichum sojae]
MTLLSPISSEIGLRNFERNTVENTRDQRQPVRTLGSYIHREGRHWPTGVSFEAAEPQAPAQSDREGQSGGPRDVINKNGEGSMHISPVDCEQIVKLYYNKVRGHRDRKTQVFLITSEADGLSPSALRYNPVAAPTEYSPRLFGTPLGHIYETFDILRSIRNNEGWRGLFRGLGPSLAGVIPATAVKFYVYGNCKRLGAWYLQCDEDEPVGAWIVRNKYCANQSDQTPASAFSKDTLSIEINGPNRPQLTLIDIPGIIQSATKGVSETDVAMVTEITDRYIKRPRTICLAVVSATNDAANQPILQSVRRFDPQGERTLGVITKPDQLPKGSGSESKFLELARNEDVFFKLGWHVIRNRRFDENGFSFEERNTAEAQFFRTSNFSVLSQEMVGIEALRARLSHLLFEHVKAELPRLSEDLEQVLQIDRHELNLLGDIRSDPTTCRVYLAQLSMECQEICKASFNGNYEQGYFKMGAEVTFSLENKSTIARLRAAVQYSNSKFAKELQKKGHKYFFSSMAEKGPVGEENLDENNTSTSASPKPLSKKESVAWVRKILLHSRGTELIGNFNPHLIGELFWEQSQPWENLASSHIEQVSQLCKNFLTNLLEQKAPKEIQGRIWASMVQDTLKQRKQAAYDDLAKLINDQKEFPINYNHYYTDIIEQRRQERLKTRLEPLVPGNFAHVSYMNCSRGLHYEKYSPEVDIDKIISACVKSNAATTIDMDRFSGEEALDCEVFRVNQGR